MCEILEEVLEGDFEKRTKQFVQYARDDPSWTFDIMFSISHELSNRTALSKGDPAYLNPTSVSGYFKPIKKAV